MATWSKGTVLTFGSAVANLTSISDAGGTADVIDVTTHDTEGNWREYIPGWVDGSEISCEGRMETDQKALMPKVGTLQTDATISYPFTAALIMTADMIMTEFQITAEYEEETAFTATFKISGEPTFPS